MENKKRKIPHLTKTALKKMYLHILTNWLAFTISR